jgi:hypothetical protein
LYVAVCPVCDTGGSSNSRDKAILAVQVNIEPHMTRPP